MMRGSSLDRMRDNIVRYNATGRFGLSGCWLDRRDAVFWIELNLSNFFRPCSESAAQGRILIAGTGVDSLAETISRTEFAATLGYHFALACPPYFYKPMMSSQVLFEHYRRVADASRIPILLYSVPQFTGVALEADVVARLAEHPNIAGMKDSSGNVDRLGQILASVPSNFHVMTGASTTIYPSMVLGAKGAILALADFVPEACVALYDAIVAGESAKALELQRRLIPASKKIVGELGISGVKYAMDFLGYYGGPARRPLLPLGESQKREVEALVSKGATAFAGIVA